MYTFDKMFRLFGYFTPKIVTVKVRQTYTRLSTALVH